MKKIGRIVGVLLVVGLLLGLVPPALAAVDIGQAAPSLPLLDNGQGKDKGKPWHFWGKVTVLKGKVEKAELVDSKIIVHLEGVELPIKVSKDAIKRPLKSRIWSGIEYPEALEGSVIVALVYKDGDVYIAKHIAIVPGRTYGHYCGEVRSLDKENERITTITIKPAKPLLDGDKLTFTVVKRTKFLNGEPKVGDWVTVIARKPYKPGMVALAVVTCRKPPLLPKVIRLEGTIASISDSTITLNIDGVFQSITYDEGTIVVIRGATSLVVGEKAVVIARKGDNGQLLAKGVFAGLKPVHVIQWLKRQISLIWPKRPSLSLLEFQQP